MIEKNVTSLFLLLVFVPFLFATGPKNPAKVARDSKKVIQSVKNATQNAARVSKELGTFTFTPAELCEQYRFACESLQEAKDQAYQSIAAIFVSKIDNQRKIEELRKEHEKFSRLVALLTNETDRAYMAWGEALLVERDSKFLPAPIEPEVLEKLIPLETPSHMMQASTIPHFCRGWLDALPVLDETPHQVDAMLFALQGRIWTAEKTMEQSLQRYWVARQDALSEENPEQVAEANRMMQEAQQTIMQTARQTIQDVSDIIYFLNTL
ncbi:MAG: hypothetical protein IKO35_02080, partial [Elusimicrobiaceae bacterium]|nr:hypothetical protein [Elusimicrobiaceae bacterium]